MESLVDDLPAPFSGHVYTGCKPRVDYLGPIDGAQRCLLCMSAAVEQNSEHPIARAILSAVGERGMDLPEAADFRALTGSGALGTVHGAAIMVAKPAALQTAASPFESGYCIMKNRGGRLC